MRRISKVFPTSASVLAGIICLANAGLLYAQDVDNGSILSRSDYVFPPYDIAAETTDITRYASRAEYETAVGDPSFELQKIAYVSDGLSVVCYLYKPVEVNDAVLPAIIFNRGGFIRGDTAAELATMFHRLASEGFVILAPMYRGSDGGEGHDQMGGGDLNDLMHVVTVANSLGFVDMDNLFAYGESRGGMMTLQAVRDEIPIRAAAVFGAFTDLEVLIASDPERYGPMTLQIWPDYESHKEEIHTRRSAVAWAGAIDVPVLIMHGGADTNIDPGHALALAQKLNEHDRVYELAIYAEDDHILSRNRHERDARTVAWFRTYMK